MCGCAYPQEIFDSIFFPEKMSMVGLIWLDNYAFIFVFGSVSIIWYFLVCHSETDKIDTRKTLQLGKPNLQVIKNSTDGKSSDWWNQCSQPDAPKLKTSRLKGCFWNEHLLVKLTSLCTIALFLQMSPITGWFGVLFSFILTHNSILMVEQSLSVEQTKRSRFLLWRAVSLAGNLRHSRSTEFVVFLVKQNGNQYWIFYIELIFTQICQTDQAAWSILVTQ